MSPTVLGGVEDVKSRRAEYAEQTRAALIAAAPEAFAEDGFTATSLTQMSYGRGRLIRLSRGRYRPASLTRDNKHQIRIGCLR